MTNIINFKPIRRCALCKTPILQDDRDEIYKITLLTGDGGMRVYDYDTEVCRNRAVYNAEQSPEIHITDRAQLSDKHLRLSVVVAPMPERIMIK